MGLLINSKCQLILDEPKPKRGLEIIVYGDKYTIIEREDDSTEFFFDMPKDGLYQYYILDFKEDESPEDLLEYIQDWSILPEYEIFSICKLRNCLLRKEKDYITKFLKGCATNSHCSNDTDDITRDFLLATIFVLEHLICTGQLPEATQILENISSCTLCSDVKSNNCGCNGRNN